MHARSECRAGRALGFDGKTLIHPNQIADANAVLQDAAVRQALDAQGLTVVGGSAADFKRVIDADVKRWGPVITRIGVKLD